MKTKLFLIFLLFYQIAWGLDVPKLEGRVNDYSNTLKPEEITKLETKLKNFEDSTSTQVVVLMMKSLDGESLEDFSMKVAETWKIGQKDKNNGVILLFFMDDHKDRIEVGYGLESQLTDAVSKWILDKEVEPRFKSEKYYEGIDIETDKVFASIAGTYQKEIAPAMERERKNGEALLYLLILAVVAGILGYTYWPVSGFVGGIGTPFIWASIFGTLSLSALVIAVILGFIAGIVAHAIMSVGLGGGITGTDFGDGFVFSGGGGDGFSGGGGSFGGGGASGGW